MIFLEDQSEPSQLITDKNNQIIIKNAKRLPTKGKNFATYSWFLSSLGRTCIHYNLRDVIIDAYKLLEQRTPGVKYIYGETGWKNGGNFWPHRTHRNGLSVDFMVPVLNDKKNTSMMLWIANAWGYNLRFNDRGICEPYHINFNAVIQHLITLQEVCPKHGLKIKRVIFDPPLTAILKKLDKNHQLHNIPFMQEKAWFPHDSHYHVDFDLVKR